MSVTARTICTDALTDLGIVGAEDPIAAADMQVAFTRLNAMINGWAAQTKTQRFVKREVFSVIANQQTYTMGPSGDFNTTVPSDLEGAGLLLNSSSPPVEIPRGLLTTDAWEAIQIKALSNSLWTDVYFQPTYTAGLATVTLWPVPNTALNSCVLYSLDTLQPFSNLSTGYNLPYAYQLGLQYGLEELLIGPFAVKDPVVVGQAMKLASRYLMILKRANYTITDLPIDPALTRSYGAGYNINSGTGGGATS